VSRRPRRLFRYAAVFVAGLAVAWVASAALGATSLFLTSSDGTPIYGERPTGLGLPLVGATGTTGAGDYSSALKAYHDSGAYQQDLQTVDAQARAYLTKRVKKLRKKAKKKCHKHHAVSAKKCREPKLALVLDIDETALSNYSNIAATNFSGTTAALAIGATSGNDPVIQPTLDLFNLARSKGVGVFFVTGRPSDISLIQTATVNNLTAAGYHDWQGLEMKPLSDKTLAFKTAARARIEAAGYRIVANVGDQESDLEGGHADRAFKLPDPFYFIGDT
jgi:predicted secreted acid phosphatase